MRHCAIAGNPKACSIPMGERLYVKVIVNGSTKEEHKAFWFAKSTVTGKVLDLLADRFGMSSDSNSLQLVKISAEGYSILHNHEALADQVEDGSTLALFRSHQDVQERYLNTEMAGEDTRDIK